MQIANQVFLRWYGNGQNGLDKLFKHHYQIRTVDGEQCLMVDKEIQAVVIRCSDAELVLRVRGSKESIDYFLNKVLEIKEVLGEGKKPTEVKPVSSF